MNPSLALLPCAHDPGKLYSVLPDTGTGDFTVNRNGTATYFDKDGILRTAQANEPRLDFDPLTGEFKGVLVEPSATNYIIESEKFNNSIYTSNNIGVQQVIGNSSIAPNGLIEMNEIIESNELSQHLLEQRRGLWGDTPNFVISCFFKQKSTNRGFLLQTANATTALVTFNPITKIITLQGTQAIGAYYIEYPNNIFRIVLIGSTTAAAIGARIRVGLFDLEIDYNQVSRIYQGDGTSSIYAWGLQREEGSSATSYIPTVASQVTRPADIITVPNYSTLFGSRNQRHIEVNNSKLGFLNEDTLQLPEGHNKLVLEKLGLIPTAETTQLGTTTLKYGVRTNIKSEFDQILALNPSLVMIPGKGSSGSLQTIFPNDGTADFTVSRNGTATFLGSNGLIQTAQANEPRLEFNTDGSFRGVLVEPAATNLALQSEAFTDVYWTKQNTTVGAKDSDGFSLLTDSVGTNLIYGIYRNATFYAGDGLTYSTTWFIKKGTARYIRITTQGNGSYALSDIFSIIIDLQTNTIISGNTLGGFVVEFFGNNVKITLSRAASGSNSLRRWGVQILNSAIPIAEEGEYSGTGNLNVFLRYAQVELGGVATSYIPTVATTITRPADVISRTNAQDLIGQTEGSVYFEGFFYNILANNGVVFVSNSDDSKYFQILITPTGRLRFATVTDTTGFATTSSANNTININTFSKLILSYSEGVYKIFLNGVLLITQNAGVFSNLSVIRFTQTNLALTANNSYGKFYLIKTPLSDSQAIALTTL